MATIDFQTPGAYEVLAVADTPLGLTVANIAPGRDTQALISAESYDIRWRADGGEPSATSGMLLTAGNSILLSGKESLNNLRMHFVTSEAAVHVHYFHQM